MIILTTNLVAEEEKATIGFAQTDSTNTKVGLDMEAFNQHFSPEFRGRLDKIILFNPIGNIIDKIVSKNLKELASQLADKKVRLVVNNGVKKYFAQNCFNKKGNARELDRVIDTNIKQAIADEMLFGKLRNGGVVIIDYPKKSKKLTFKFSGLEKLDKMQLEPS